jgi:AcrR family transcriptional regulator
MTSGRDRLLTAAAELLTADPTQEPSTRELYDAAGVAAPTLYHHFGTKEGLLDAVVEHAFQDYLDRKNGMRRTGDLVADFAAGWDLHVAFGLANPVLYGLMYAPSRTTAAARTADGLLRSGLQRMHDAGLLRLDVDTAATMTTSMAIGCVTQLNRQGRSADDPAALKIRDCLIGELTGRPMTPTSPAQAARLLLGQLTERSDAFTPAESALLGQWLLVIADEHDAPTSTKGDRP